MISRMAAGAHDDAQTLRLKLVALADKIDADNGESGEIRDLAGMLGCAVRALAPEPGRWLAYAHHR